MQENTTISNSINYTQVFNSYSGEGVLLELFQFYSVQKTFKVSDMADY